MPHFLFRFSIPLLLVSLLTGCRMCGSPYDYTGPLCSGKNCDWTCDPMYRAGSIFSNGAFVHENPYKSHPQATQHGCQNCGPSPGRTVPQETSSDGRQQGKQHGGIGIPDGMPNGHGIVPELPETPEEPDEHRFIPPNLPPLDQPLRPETRSATPFDANSTGIDWDELRREDPSITDIEIINVEEEIGHHFPVEATPSPKAGSAFKTSPIKVAPPQRQQANSLR